jgi:hypothetical protein
MAANRGATGAAPQQGGSYGPQISGDSVGRSTPRMAESRSEIRIHRAVDGDDNLRSLAPATHALFGAEKPRSIARGNRAGLRRDPARLVGGGARATVRTAGRQLDASRRTRLRSGLCPRLAQWLRRTARVHAHLCAIVRLYGSPTRAGGQSLQGETYAARAAAGDRTLLHESLTRSIDEITAIREELEAEMAAAPPTAAPPGSKAKVDEMARRVERGDALFIDGDSKGAGDGSSDVQG